MSKKHRVYVTRKIPEIGINLLKEHFDVEVYPGDLGMPRDLLKQKVQNIDGLLCLLSETINREIIDIAPNIKIISNYAVGYNNIDVDYATQKGIVVTNTPEVLTDATADLAWALLMAVSRRIMESDNLIRRGEFKGWRPRMLLGADIKGQTLGIMGGGRIGSAMAERSRGWNMNILYFNLSQNQQLEEQLGAKRCSLEELLAESDFVSIHLPLTSETQHLIDATALKKMKSTAFIINTARGAIIDEKALVRALKEKWIAGAGLDVFENEPDLAPGLADLQNAVIVPHIGSATVSTRNKMAEIAAKNLIAVLNGEKPTSPVNPEVLR